MVLPSNPLPHKRFNVSENQHTSQAWYTLRVYVVRSCVLSSFRRAVISVQILNRSFVYPLLGHTPFNNDRDIGILHNFSGIV